jgi:hypothetical protein
VLIPASPPMAMLFPPSSNNEPHLIAPAIWLVKLAE